MLIILEQVHEYQGTMIENLFFQAAKDRLKHFNYLGKR